MATLQAAAEEVAHAAPSPIRRCRPSRRWRAASTPSSSWVEQNELAYRKLIESAGSVPEVGALIAEVRDRTSARILEGLGAGAAPRSHAWPCARGCGSSTARSWTGSSTAT